MFYNYNYNDIGVFGNEQQQKGWIVATWEDSRLLGDQITRDFNVHAIFNRVALIVGFPKEIDALKLRGFGAYYARVFNENEKLFGLEFDTKYAEVISRAFAHWEIYKVNLTSYYLISNLKSKSN